MLSRMMCVIIVVALGGFVMVTGAAYADTMIDIANPGFESGSDQGTPSDWSSYDPNDAGRWTITGGLPPHGGSYWGYIGANDDLYQALMIGGSNLQVSVGDQITINLYQGKRTDQGSLVQALDVRIWKDAVGGVIGNLLGDSGDFGEAPAGGWAAHVYLYRRLVGGRSQSICGIGGTESESLSSPTQRGRRFRRIHSSPRAINHCSAGYGSA